MPVIASRAAAALKAFGHMVSSGITIARDTYFNLNSLLLKANSGDRVDLLKELPPPYVQDYSTNNFQLLPGSTVRPSKQSPAVDAYHSTYFDGSSSVDFALSTSGACAFGTGDFTIEFWVYPVTSPNNNWSPFLTLGANGGGQEIRISQNINGTGWGWLYPNTTSSADVYTGFGTLPIGRWHHIAVARSGTTFRLFLNGAIIATDTGATFNFTNTSLFRMAYPQSAYPDGSTNCFMHSFRVVKGTAVYTAAFTPPTTVLTAISGTTVLAHQGPRIIDSVGNLAVTLNTTPTVSRFVPVAVPSAYDFYGSAYLNGSSDYIVIPYNAALDVLAVDFTIEAWVYPQASTSVQVFIGQWNQTAGAAGFLLTVHGSNFVFHFGAYSESTALLTSTTTIKLNNWYHVAVVRSGNTFTMYVNGSSALGATATSSATRGSLTTVNLTVGNYYTSAGAIGATGSTYFSGYVSNLRIVKSTAVYTSNFTPTTFLTAVANTSLLTLQYNGPISNNGFVDRSNFAAPVTRAANTSQGTLSPYIYEYSTYFNGSSNLATNVGNFGLSGGNLTMEAWIYFTAYSASYSGNYNCCIVGSGNGTSGFEWTISGTATSFTNMNFFARSGGTVTMNTNSTYSFQLNTWYHVAIVIDTTATTISFYVNGARINSATSSTWLDLGTVYLGYIPATGYNYWFYGYMSNVRITKQVMYSGTSYIVPVKGLTPIDNTILFLLNDGTFIDKSKNSYAVTVTGSPVVTTFSPFSPYSVTQKPGYFSTYFNGSSRLVTPTGMGISGTGNFTVEAWIYLTVAQSAGSKHITDSATSNFLFLKINTGNICVGRSQIAEDTAFNCSLNTNTWYHVAFSRSGTNIYGFLNGALQVSSTNSNSYATGIMAIGSDSGGAQVFTGYIHGLRYSTSALYTSAFSAPTTPGTVESGTVLYTLRNNTITDESVSNVNITVGAGTPVQTTLNPYNSSALTVTAGAIIAPYITAGSMFFDGTGDLLSLPTSTVYDLSASSLPWTIECWVFLTGAATAYRTFISKRGGTTAEWEIGVNPTNSYFYFYTSTVYLTNIAVRNSVWTHCAAAFDGTTLRLFVNGVQGYSGAVNATTGTSIVYVGAVYSATQTVTGYISDLRVSKNKCYYTAPFIPNSSPLPVLENTVLSLKGDSAGVYDTFGSNNIEAYGNAKISTAIKKFNSGSLQFNSATSDYFYISGNPIFNTGTNDWTCEAWVYLNALPTSDAWPASWSSTFVIASTGTPGQADGTDCIIGQTKLMIQINDTSYVSISTHNMVINTWYHLAYVRNNNTINFFVNGTSLGQVALSVSNGTGSGTYIGCETGQGAYFNGYIDDLRFSRFARYTGPYFPIPTTSFQETGPSDTETGTLGVAFVAGDGLSSATSGASAAAIKAQTGTNVDGVYWINLPTVGPTQVYCIMNSAADGGGWMMAMKATRGTTFSYSSTHWTTVTTLNPTANNRADGDAKFNTMNYFPAKDMMALFPDITTNGGGLGTNPYSCWSWLYNGFCTTYTSRVSGVSGPTSTLINLFANTGRQFVGDAKLSSNWASGVFSSQSDVRFYGINWTDNYNCRWGFGWNENGGGLFPNGVEGSDDVSGGIGMSLNSYSAGDAISCCNDSTGINRSARVEVYIR